MFPQRRSRSLPLALPLQTVTFDSLISTAPSGRLPHQELIVSLKKIHYVRGSTGVKPPPHTSTPSATVICYRSCQQAPPTTVKLRLIELPWCVLRSILTKCKIQSQIYFLIWEAPDNQVLVKCAPQSAKCNIMPASCTRRFRINSGVKNSCIYKGQAGGTGEGSGAFLTLLALSLGNLFSKANLHVSPLSM